MAKADTHISHPVGLDIGTSRIVSAIPAESGYEYRSQLNSFVTLPNSKMREAVLRRENIPHTIVGPDILVHGNESERFADLLQMDTRRPMSRGFINPSETESLNVMRQIILSLIGPAKQAGQKAYFSVPAAPIGAAENLTYHEATLNQILSDIGYTAKSVNEGLAVVFGELESSNYTGIGISIGGGLCNVCLSYLAVPVTSFSVTKAGDFVDASTASVTGELANRIRLAKEDGFALNGANTDKIHQVLAVYYEDLIHSLVASLKNAFGDPRSLPKLGRAIPLVLSGGSVMPRGFRDKFEAALKAVELPLPISEIRLADNPLHTTAKGALIAALSEM